VATDPQRDAQADAPAPIVPNRLLEAMTAGWGPRPDKPMVAPAPAATLASRRRSASERFPGEWIVVRSGTHKVRANDTDYRFRPSTDFAWLTGCHEPDAVLVMEPAGAGHTETLFLPPRPQPGALEYFADGRNSELWSGPKPSHESVAGALGIAVAPTNELQAVLDRATGVDAIVREIDGEGGARDADLAHQLSTLRLVKDEYEVASLERAVAATVNAFEDAVRALPMASKLASERWIEGTFNRRARTEGNDVGYDTIVASGSDACILHWVDNDGELREGDLLLIDGGVETKELYTADITRTFPVSGVFSPAQREVYDVVWRAQRAAFAECRPGNEFSDPHRAAMRVIAEWLVETGILRCSLDEAMADDARLYQRYTLHFSGHMLGMDVHDCAGARNEIRKLALVPGMVMTVEPGCYFRENDLTVPERYRGIGVRIEDDVLITEGGCRVLSSALPTQADDVERWMGSLLELMGDN
jgi:Xaa-Pro aminopeptidase